MREVGGHESTPRVPKPEIRGCLKCHPLVSGTRYSSIEINGARVYRGSPVLDTFVDSVLGTGNVVWFAIRCCSLAMDVYLTGGGA